MLFFRFCGCFSCSREVLRTRRSLKLALNSFENDLQSETYFRKINVKKISKNLYEMANSCVEFRKNSRFSSIFFKIHNFGTHIFLYVYTTNTQLPHMSYSGFQIHNTCYTHVKSCVYMCQGRHWVFGLWYKKPFRAVRTSFALRAPTAHCVAVFWIVLKQK